MAVILNRTLQAANGVNFVNFGFTPTSGNLLLAYCAALNSATFGTFTGAYSWTLLSAVSNTSIGFRHAIYGRVSTGNEPWFQFSIAGSTSNIAALIELDPNKLDTYVSRGQGASVGPVAAISFFNTGTAYGGVGFASQFVGSTWSAGSTSGWGSTINIDSQLTNGTAQSLAVVDYDPGAALASGVNNISINSNTSAQYFTMGTVYDGPPPGPSGGQEILTLRSQGY
jgi:hypothetical protein